MTGWLRLHRGWRDSDVFADDPCSEREAWLWLIESAAWKPCHRRGGKGDLITVERGQLHTAERTLAKLWKWDRKRVVRFLGRLERCEMIHLQKDHSGILLTISNYAKYQDKEADDGAIQGADDGPFEDHRGTTQEEGKEVKKITPSKRASPKHLLPANWQPEPLKPGTASFETVSAWEPGRLERELSKFRDHHTAHGNKFSDWQAAWRKWIGNSDDFRTSNRQPASQQSNNLRGRPDPAFELLKRGAAREARENLGEDGAPDWGTWTSLPSLGTG